MSATENRLTTDDRVAMIHAMTAATRETSGLTLDALQLVGARAIGCTRLDLRECELRWLFVAARCVIAASDIRLPLDPDPFTVRVP